METFPISTVGQLPRGPLADRLTHIRARVHRRQLNAALANGQDPWSTGELAVRASQLMSLAGRRQLARALEDLVAVAEGRGAPTPYRGVRTHVVLERREALLVVAERLREPAPVDVAVLAGLAILVSDKSSPVYVGGTHPTGVRETAARCLDTLGDLPQLD